MIKVKGEKLKVKSLFLTLCAFCFLFSSCDNYYKNDYVDNSPTSGKLKVFYSEGLQLHIKNQAFTFTSLYPHANVECVASCEAEIIDAFLKDSCKAIIINRLLGANELKAFDQKKLHPQYSPIAKTGVALITSVSTTLSKFTVDEIKNLLTGELSVKDSLGNIISPIAVLDTKCSSVSFYLRDSVIQAKMFGPKCFAVNSTSELLQKISDNPNQIGFIDFAWLSDRDDSIYKAFENKIKFMAVGRTDSIYFEPNQSSFKTGEYPFTRTIYMLRRTDDFSLAKGFEAFMAGPKGQLTFLKQGLLPIRQAERIIEVKMEPIGGQK